MSATSKMAAAMRREEDLVHLPPEHCAALLESVPLFIAYIGADERFRYINRSYAEWFGKPQREIVGRSVREILGEASYTIVRPHLRKALAGRDTRYERELIRDSRRHLVRVSFVPHGDGSRPEGIFAVAMDITDLKDTEEQLRSSEGKFHAIFDHAPSGILLVGKDGVFLDANPAFCAIAGRSRLEIVGQRAESLVVPERIADVVAARTRFRAAGTWQGEFPLARPDGSEVHLQWNVTADAYEGADLAVVTDLTERRRAEEALQGALAEKEALLRELQHRVKNNLQFILSLLALRGGQLADPMARAEFEQTASRVRAISYAQDQLYRSGDVSRIDFAEYLQSLGYALLGLHADRLTLHFETEPVLLHIGKAVPLGLVANEILSNSVRHAFPNDRAGTITVGLRHIGPDDAELRIGDDGVGAPGGQPPIASRTSGMALMALLAMQAGAKVEQDWTAGVRFRITFSVP